MPGWLNDAVFYEIYPQSFMDSNGDGIGDFRGIGEKLDYLEALGVNAIWMNSCYESSFYDAGYDVKDYYKAAPRYGTNDDLRRLFDAVHARGMHILLDLVPGHTAIDHPWFIESCRDEVNEYTDRFIWRTGGPWGPQYRGTAGSLCGISERPGAVYVNCFSSQPALNYGFGKVTEDWQFSADSPEAETTRLAMQDVMSFWLDLGCDGFRFLSDGKGYPLAFERFDDNEHLIIAFNPSSETAEFSVPVGRISEMLLSYGGAMKKSDRDITLPPGSYAVFS